MQEEGHVPQVLPGLWEGEVKGDAGAKTVHDYVPST